jgi:hypothetical protein
VRNAEDEKATSGGKLRAWTQLVDVAKRDRNPKEGAEGSRAFGGPKDERTLKRNEAYERMNPRCASVLGDGGRRKEPTLSVRNGERVRERETR